MRRRRPCRHQDWAGHGGAIDHADGDGSLLGGGFGQGAEVQLRLDGEQFGGRWRVVGEVEAAAGADLQDPAGQAGEESAAVLERALGVHGRADPGEHAGEDRVSLAGGRYWA
jgi:hypothetical protein